MMTRTTMASALLAALLYSARPATAVIISDGIFADGDWAHSILFSNANPTATLDFTVQVLTGGNPDEWQHGQHTTDGPSSSIFDGHLFVGGGSYNPSAQGAIQSIEVSYDEINPSGLGVQTGLLATQGGNNYINFVDSCCGYTSWTTLTDDVLTGWDAIDTGGVTTGAAPDLSSSGGPIQFGYYTFSWSGTVGFFVQRDWGIDNFLVTITPVPEPATFALAALGLMGIGCRRRKRA